MEKSKAERTAEAKAKIKILVDWFAGRQLPTVPVKINGFMTINHCEKYVSTQLARMESGDIWDKQLQIAYSKLLELKTFLENEQPGANNGE